MASAPASSGDVGQHRHLNLGGVAADRLAVAAQHPDLVLHRRGIADEVAGIRVLRHESQRLALAATADEDARARPADRPRRAQRFGQPVVRPLERSVVVAPHLLADPERLLEPLVALAQRGERHPEPEVLALVPGRTQPELGPPTREDVEGRHGLGQQARVAVGDPADEEPEAQVLGLGRGERERGVPLEHRLLRWPQELHLEPVVHHRQGAHPDRLGGLSQRGPGGPDRFRASRPGETRDVDVDVHGSSFGGEG